jgi:hypothetical protein
MIAAPSERSNRIQIAYIPPKKPELQKPFDFLKQHRALETLQQVFAPFRLPEDLLLRAQECGMVNAWYRREDSGPTVTICYEFLQHILQNLPEQTTAAGITYADALVGQFFYVVVHEFGHALFDIYNVPVFGREEDAADQIAANVMLQFGKERARRLVGGAAYSFRKYISDLKDKPKVSIPLAAFSSTHGQPEQRFYNLLCAAYGTDPETFGFLVDDEYLPKTRAPSCAVEIQKFRKAMLREIRPHVDLELAARVLETRWLAQPVTTGSATSPR